MSKLPRPRGSAILQRSGIPKPSNAAEKVQLQIASHQRKMEVAKQAREFGGSVANMKKYEELKNAPRVVPQEEVLKRKKGHEYLISSATAIGDIRAGKARPMKQSDFEDTAQSLRVQKAKELKLQHASGVHKRLVVNPTEVGEEILRQERQHPSERVYKNVGMTPSMKNLYIDNRSMSLEDRKRNEAKEIASKQKETIKQLCGLYETMDRQTFQELAEKHLDYMFKMIRIYMSTYRGDEYLCDEVEINLFIKRVLEFFQRKSPQERCIAGLRDIFQQMPIPKFKAEKSVLRQLESLTPLATLQKPLVMNNEHLSGHGPPTAARALAAAGIKKPKARPASQPVPNILVQAPTGEVKQSLLRPPSKTRPASAGARPSTIKSTLEREVHALEEIQEASMQSAEAIRRKLNGFTSNFCRIFITFHNKLRRNKYEIWAKPFYDRINSILDDLEAYYDSLPNAGKNFDRTRVVIQFNGFLRQLFLDTKTKEIGLEKCKKMVGDRLEASAELRDLRHLKRSLQVFIDQVQNLISPYLPQDEAAATINEVLEKSREMPTSSRTQRSPRQSPKAPPPRAPEGSQSPTNVAPQAVIPPSLSPHHLQVPQARSPPVRIHSAYPSQQQTSSNQLQNESPLPHRRVAELRHSIDTPKRKTRENQTERGGFADNSLLDLTLNEDWHNRNNLNEEAGINEVPQGEAQGPSKCPSGPRVLAPKTKMTVRASAQSSPKVIKSPLKRTPSETSEQEQENGLKMLARDAFFVAVQLVSKEHGGELTPIPDELTREVLQVARDYINRLYTDNEAQEIIIRALKKTVVLPAEFIKTYIYHHQNHHLNQLYEDQDKAFLWRQKAIADLEKAGSENADDGGQLDEMLKNEKTSDEIAAELLNMTSEEAASINESAAFSILDDFVISVSGSEHSKSGEIAPIVSNFEAPLDNLPIITQTQNSILQNSPIPATDLLSKTIEEQTSNLEQVIRTQLNEKERHERLSQVFNQPILFRLSPTAFDRQNFWQCRGSDFPAWFPGYFASFPDCDPAPHRQISADYVFNRAWRCLAPHL